MCLFTFRRSSVLACIVSTRGKSFRTMCRLTRAAGNLLLQICKRSNIHSEKGANPKTLALLLLARGQAEKLHAPCRQACPNNRPLRSEGERVPIPGAANSFAIATHYAGAHCRDMAPHRRQPTGQRCINIQSVKLSISRGRFSTMLHAASTTSWDWSQSRETIK